MAGLKAFSRSGRTRIIGAVLLLAVAGFLFMQGVLAPKVRTQAPRPPVPVANPIVEENKKPGTDAWRIKDVTTTSLQGFASRTSVQPRGHITFYVTTTFPAYSVDVYRMGYYDGLGGRLVWSRRGIPGQEQDDPTVDDTTRMVEAHWSPSFRLRVGKDWTTGVYLAKLSGPDGQGSYIPFTVREGTERAPIVFQSSVTTWQAYNMWGGHSLYFGETYGGGQSTAGRSKVVSFDRPYSYGAGASDFMGLELPVLQWLEEKDYNVAYATDIDLHQDPLLLSGRRALLSLGHDEYWSTRMRDHVEAALQQGTNLAFFGANAMYRHIRFEHSPLGRDRHEVNYRSTSDPITDTDRKEATVQWRDYPIERPEDSVLGAMYECNPVHGDAVVYDPLSWLFNGSSLQTGDTVDGIVGDEYDRVFPDKTHPKRLWVLFRTPVECGYATSVQDTTFARFASGAGVFNAGTSRFVCIFSGCGPKAPKDARMQRVVQNLLDSYLQPNPPVGEPDPREFSTSTRQVEPPREYTTTPTRRYSTSTEPATPAPPTTPWWQSLPTMAPPQNTPEPTRRSLIP